jgi:thiamine monophosphate kinase
VQAVSAATCIGEITQGTSVRVVGEHGQPIELSRTGFRHFS